MSTQRLGPYSVTVDNLVVARIRLWSNVARARSATNGYGLTVGVQRGAGVSWLAKWDQRAQALGAATSQILSGSEDLNYPLRKGDVVVAEVVSYGTPAERMTGLVAEVQLSRVGEVESTVAEARLGREAGRTVRRPLLSNPLAGDKDLTDLVRQMNDGGLPDFSVPIYFAEEPTVFPSDPRFATSLEGSNHQRVFMSTLAPGGAGLLLVSGVGYWVYLGRTTVQITPQYVEFHVSTVGVGAQTAEVGFFSTPAAPNKAAQSLTKLVATATVDSLTVGTGVKRNTNAFATAIPAGTHLWAGIRTAMATTQPTIWGIGVDMNQGQFLTLAAAGALTGAGPWAGAKVAAGTGVGCPDLRGTLD